MTPGAPDTVIVGYGHAARSFHAPAVQALAATGYASGAVGIVEPRLRQTDPGLPRGATVRARLSELDVDRNSIVHVCTGPDSHAELVLAANQLGYRRFIVEKPMATTVADARRLVALCERGDADIIVVSNWSASALTDEIRRVMRTRAAVGVQAIALTQLKPRMERTMTSPTHRSAFDVEVPHLVALALSLVDEPVKLVDASSTDLVVGEERYPAMGSARIELRTAGGVPLLLRSDLTAPRRERSAQVRWEDGVRLTGFHPCDSTDRYSQLFTWAADGRRLGRQLLYDDTVGRLLRTAYGYFGGKGPKPVSDVHFGAAVTAIIETARAASTSREADHDLGWPLPSGTTEHHCDDFLEVGHASCSPH